MADPRLGNALKWALTHSGQQANGTQENGAHENGTSTGTSDEPKTRGIDPDLLRSLLGGPSDADLMRQAMTVIQHPEATHDAKMIAWDNLEQLIESLDNANNMQVLDLWTPLIQKLDDPDSQVRTMACWCTSTAVQNNIKTQEMFFANPGALDKLVSLALSDPDAGVRRKAVNAMSSTVRNYQAAMDRALELVPAHLKPDENVDAADMDAVDRLVQGLRDHAALPNGTSPA